jgi:hypothetical protein
MELQMKRIKPLVLSALVLMVLPSMPLLADGLFYIGGKVGATSVDADIEESFELILDGDDDGLAAALGLRLGNHLAFELAYHDFGSVPAFAAQCPECLALSAPLEGDTTAVSLTFLPHLPITDSFLAYGKIGIMSWETSVDEIGSGLENAFEDYSDEDLVYGVGLRYLLPGPLGVFAEFESFADSFETVSLGATLGF